MVRFAIAVALVLSASTASAQATDPANPPAGFELSQELRAQGEVMVDEAGQALLDNLIDPASARYRSVFIRTTIGRDQLPHLTICGQVNAKNAMGGYTGWTAFAYSGGAVGLLVGRGGIVGADVVCQPGRGHWDATDYAARVTEKAKLEE